MKCRLLRSGLDHHICSNGHQSLPFVVTQIKNGHAAADIRDLRGLIDAWREARRTAWQTTIKVLTTGVLAALLVGIAIKLRLMGGPQ